jgi:high-affinity iron transporter
MEQLIPGMIMGFREGLEAFVIVAIMLQYLNHIHKQAYKKYVLRGVLGGIAASLLIGSVLYLLSTELNKTDEIAKIWESIASMMALILVTFFIIWMIKHGRNMVSEVQGQVSHNLSKSGLFSLAFIMVVREGTEISIFTFAGQYTISSIGIGIVTSLILAVLIYKALIKVNLKLLFNITLAYLILQAGFLLGYAVHEALSALKSLDFIAENHLLLTKAFDVSGTILDHKEGVLGIGMYVGFGWYSRPEWIQFILQYVYTLGMFIFWRHDLKQNNK